jgi:hypothetical protein
VGFSAVVGVAITTQAVLRTSSTPIRRARNSGEGSGIVLGASLVVVEPVAPMVLSTYPVIRCERLLEAVAALNCLTRCSVIVVG